MIKINYGELEAAYYDYAEELKDFNRINSKERHISWFDCHSQEWKNAYTRKETREAVITTICNLLNVNISELMQVMASIRRHCDKTNWQIYIGLNEKIVKAVQR